MPRIPTVLVVASSLWAAACTCDPVTTETDALVPRSATLEVEGEVFGSPFAFTDAEARVITAGDDITDGPENEISVEHETYERYRLVIRGSVPIIEGHVTTELEHLRFGAEEVGTNWGRVGGVGERFEVVRVGRNVYCDYEIEFEADGDWEALSWCDEDDPMGCADSASGFGVLSGRIVSTCD